jgi:hypothetical protein
MKNLFTLLAAAVFTLSAGVVHAADDAKKAAPAKTEPAKAEPAKATAKAASAASAASAPVKKKEKKGGC